MKRATYTGIVLVVILFICAFVYFVSGLSGTSAPIKKYQYFGSVDQLLNGLRRYASASPGMMFKITDTTGTSTNGYAIYSDIKMMKGKHHIEYNLMCEKSEDGSELVTTKAELVFAYDSTNVTGGYQLNARGVKMLVDYFDSNFLVGLKNNQNIKLSPIRPTFFDPIKHIWNGD